mmetsp:Transcript_65925/g.137298  ORF Transcript_65925/g.137298 Transcript_65925/m.137298 type:complete len:144 (-) Transcript_65925:1042-1473(-)
MIDLKMNIVLHFHPFLGRKMSIDLLSSAKKDSISSYFNRKKKIIIFKTGALIFSLDSVLFRGFMSGLPKNLIIFDKFGQFLNNGKIVDCCFFIFKSQKDSRKYRILLHGKREQFINYKNKFIFEKSLTYLMDRKKKSFLTLQT